MTDGYFSPIEVDRLGRAMPHGIVRFTESGKLADWREDILGWMVTGSDRVWGDPLELVRTFGPYEAIAVVSPTPPTEPTEQWRVRWPSGLAIGRDSFESAEAYIGIRSSGVIEHRFVTTSEWADVTRAGFVAGNQEQGETE